MFIELKNCYEGSAGNFVRVIVDKETNVMYLVNKLTMIPMIAPDGTPSIYDGKVKIVNDKNAIAKLSQHVGWQNIFINKADGTMYVGGENILCQLLDGKGKPKIFNK